MITEAPGQPTVIHEEGPEERPRQQPTDPTEEPDQPYRDRATALLDVDELAAISFNSANFGTQAAMIFAMLQQGAIQLAAIRELLEAEHAVLVADRIHGNRAQPSAIDNGDGQLTLTNNILGTLT